MGAGVTHHLKLFSQSFPCLPFWSKCLCSQLMPSSWPLCLPPPWARTGVRRGRKTVVNVRVCWILGFQVRKARAVQANHQLELFLKRVRWVPWLPFDRLSFFSTGWSTPVQEKGRPRLGWICPLQRGLALSRGLKRISSGPRSAGTSHTGHGA